MEQLKEITQKPEMRPFVNKICESVFKYGLPKLYFKQGCL